MFAVFFLTLHFNNTSHSGVTAKSRYSTKWGPATKGKELEKHTCVSTYLASKWCCKANSYLVSWPILPLQILISFGAPGILNNAKESVNVKYQILSLCNEIFSTTEECIRKTASKDMSVKERLSYAAPEWTQSLTAANGTMQSKSL